MKKIFFIFGLLLISQIAFSLSDPNTILEKYNDDSDFKEWVLLEKFPKKESGTVSIVKKDGSRTWNRETFNFKFNDPDNPGNYYYLWTTFSVLDYSTNDNYQQVKFGVKYGVNEAKSLGRTGDTIVPWTPSAKNRFYGITKGPETVSGFQGPYVLKHSSLVDDFPNLMFYIYLLPKEFSVNSSDADNSTHKFPFEAWIYAAKLKPREDYRKFDQEIYTLKQGLPYTINLTNTYKGGHNTVDVDAKLVFSEIVADLTPKISATLIKDSVIITSTNSVPIPMHTRHYYDFKELNKFYQLSIKPLKDTLRERYGCTYLDVSVSGAYHGGGLLKISDAIGQSTGQGQSYSSYPVWFDLAGKPCEEITGIEPYYLQGSTWKAGGYSITKESISDGCRLTSSKNLSNANNHKWKIICDDRNRIWEFKISSDGSSFTKDKCDWTSDGLCPR